MEGSALSTGWKAYLKPVPYVRPGIPASNRGQMSSSQRQLRAGPRSRRKRSRTGLPPPRPSTLARNISKGQERGKKVSEIGFKVI